MNYYLVWFLSQTDGQTDRKRCIWAHRAICTGGLKNTIAPKTKGFLNVLKYLVRYWPTTASSSFLRKLWTSWRLLSSLDAGPALERIYFTIPSEIINNHTKYVLLLLKICSLLYLLNLDHLQCFWRINDWWRTNENIFKYRDGPNRWGPQAHHSSFQTNQICGAKISTESRSAD